jgi:heat shock protein HslJ
MRFQTPAMTAASCTPPEVMNQEATYLASLRNIVTYTKDGDKLLGYTTGNQLLITFSPAPTVTLEGTVWELRFQDYGNNMLSPIVVGTEVTATFAAGQMTGSTGCNTYHAAYTLGDDGAFSAPDVVSTRMSCEEPKGIMDQEAQYLLNIQNAKKLVQTGGLLVLTDAADKPLAAFGTNY